MDTERRNLHRRATDRLEECVIELEKNKLSIRMFFWVAGSLGGVLVLIFASIITLHIKFSDFKVEVVDRISEVDKSVERKIAEVKVEIARNRYRVPKIGWDK